MLLAWFQMLELLQLNTFTASLGSPGAASIRHPDSSLDAVRCRKRCTKCYCQLLGFFRCCIHSASCPSLGCSQMLEMLPTASLSPPYDLILGQTLLSLWRHLRSQIQHFSYYIFCLSHNNGCPKKYFFLLKSWLIYGCTYNSLVF